MSDDFDAETSRNSGVFDQAKTRLAQHTVGFLDISSRDGIQDAGSAGSGTLTVIGPNYGILTAAHVLDKLPSSGNIGLLRFPIFGSRNQRLMIDMSLATKIPIGASPFGPSGPDIGFLCIPRLVADNIADLSGVFFNLDRRKDVILSGDLPRRKYFDSLVGVIEERTKEMQPDFPNTRQKSFEASAEVGDVTKIWDSGGLDYLEFEPQSDVGYQPPSTYRGVSGGGLWRIFCDEDGSREPSVSEVCLLGVAFYETPSRNGRRAIVCHDRRSVYVNLIDEVNQRLGG